MRDVRRRLFVRDDFNKDGKATTSVYELKPGQRFGGSPLEQVETHYKTAAQEFLTTLDPLDVYGMLGGLDQVHFVEVYYLYRGGVMARCKHVWRAWFCTWGETYLAHLWCTLCPGCKKMKITQEEYELLSNNPNLPFRVEGRTLYDYHNFNRKPNVYTYDDSSGNP